MAVGINITTSGPLLKSGVAKTIIAHISERFVQRIVELGEQRLDIVLRPRDTAPGVYLTIAQAQSRGYTPSQGDYREGVGHKTAGLQGVIHDGDALYGPWLEKGGGRFKGYAAFRKTAQWLRGQVSKEAQDFAKVYIRRLGGK